MFASFMPYIMELLGETLRSNAPNMKKKSDPAFDELKTSVVKPLKDITLLFRDHFQAISDAFKDKSSIAFTSGD